MIQKMWFGIRLRKDYLSQIIFFSLFIKTITQYTCLINILFMHNKLKKNPANNDQTISKLIV